jgi:hypothetical protein
VRLFLVQEGQESYYVEADSILEAILKWKAWMAGPGGDPRGIGDPESVSLLADEGVLR